MSIWENPAFEKWNTPQKILVVLAHPDDPEFFCGASLATWAAAGHHISYCLLTCGDKGTKDLALTSSDLCGIRQAEQQEAAAALGVEKVHFLSYPDGYLVPDIDLRKSITRAIRQEKPDILVTCDPTSLFVGEVSINHPDHRAAGQAALDAVFPAARDHLYFPDLRQDENLEPHVVREVWVCGTQNPSIILDVTDVWDQKIRALLNHKSQIGEPDAFIERMRSRRTTDSTPEHPRYEERWRRVVLG